MFFLFRCTVCSHNSASLQIVINHYTHRHQHHHHACIYTSFHVSSSGQPNRLNLMLNLKCVCCSPRQSCAAKPEGAAAAWVGRLWLFLNLNVCMLLTAGPRDMERIRTRATEHNQQPCVAVTHSQKKAHTHTRTLPPNVVQPPAEIRGKSSAIHTLHEIVHTRIQHIHIEIYTAQYRSLFGVHTCFVVVALPVAQYVCVYVCL